jgi:excisionase family DNA binding protein
LDVDRSTPEELSLEQVAHLLGYNVKTVRRHIKAKKLRARLRGGKYRVHRSDVWHVLYDRHDICGRRCLGIQRSARLRDFKISEKDHAERWVFEDWGQPETCEELPVFDLTLDVTEIRRVIRALRREKNQQDYEELRNELRDRIQSEHGQAPHRFIVVLKLDDAKSYELYRRIFRIVKGRPRIPGVALEDLEADAIQHLSIKAMPHIVRARNVEAYLAKALRNLYADKLRHAGIGRKGVKKRAGLRNENPDPAGLEELAGDPYDER